MKKTLKAFTLVECIVALTIFAVVSLSIAQVYANISVIQRQNEYMQYSLAKQMQYVEQQVQGETVPVPYSNTAEATGPKGAVDISSNNLIMIQGGVNGTFQYAYGVDVYVLYSRDINDNGSNDDDGDGIAEAGEYVYEAEGNGNLRYKYMLPATPNAANNASS
ncbi:MAG: prepilin-type N-terminal cleavage/methylation domain-containing protein [Ruminococcus sp.]|jgi:prepilin-type N-terminal cleavage/methylation domain-containing protein|nr:prepilin-type N-terminal cleavage/methylation domain-containing protein [Ruminococcus sp.]